MRKHSNPYQVRDPHNLFEVSENSSHPELNDAKRIYKFHEYTFQSATELEKFFKSEGLNPRNYWMEPKAQTELGGKTIVTINVVMRHLARSQRYAGAS